jgi:TrmH family RNA methyltransferase
VNTDRKSNIIVVLDRPQDAVNIGAVVRAIKNMGFTQLRLVNPRPFTEADLGRIAHHAEDVIATIRVDASLDDALADAVYVVGTSAIAHSKLPLRRDVEQLSRELMHRAEGETVALLFGTEDDGLANVALDHCHTIAALPTNPAYPALNLAQSVLLFLYELSRQAATTVPGPIAYSLPPPPSSPGVPHAQLEQLFALAEEALGAIGFFKYKPQAVMRTLRQVAYRSELQPQEAALLMAIARQAIYTAEHGDGRTGHAGARASAPK